MRIKTVHFQAAAFAIIYYVLSGLLFVRLVTYKNIFISYFGPVMFGIISGIVFLYLFNHRDFFPFADKLEKQERNKENYYLKEFKNYSKIIACIIISEFAGPIFLALSVRFLFPRSSNRYLIVIFSTVISTIFAVALAKGIIRLVI